MNPQRRILGGQAVALLLAACSIALAGCQTLDIGHDARKNTDISTWKGEKALMREECLVRTSDPVTVESALLDGVVGVVVPRFLANSIGAVASYLERRSDALSATTEYRAVGPLYDTYPSEGESSEEAIRITLGCLILLKGEFGAPALGKESWKDGTDCPTLPPLEEPWDACRLHRLALKAPPDFYVELGVKTANEGASIAFVPRFIDYARPTAAIGKGSKDLLFVITFATQVSNTSKVENSSFAVFTLKLPNVRVGSRLDERGTLSGISTQFQSLLPPRRDGDGNLIDEIPLEILVVVTETEDGGDFYVKAAELLREVEKPLNEQATKWIKEVLSP